MTAPPPLVAELVPVPDPLDACARFAGAPFLLFLDSAADPDRLGRHSFLAADPVTAVRSKGRLTQQLVDGAWVRVAADPLAHARALLAPHAAAPVAGVPPFQGGVAGYIGYDWGATLERIPRPRYDDLALPDVLLALYDWVIAWDHAAGRAWAISTGIPETGAARGRRAAQRLAEVTERLKARHGPDPAGDRGGPAAPHRPSAPSYPVPGVPGVRANFTRAGYLEAVARVIECIAAGDIFQANLSQRLEAPLADSPFALYRRLRRRNPAPRISSSAAWRWRARRPSGFSGWTRTAASRPGPSRGRAPAAWDPSTTPRWRARSPRARRTAPKTS